MILGRYLLKDKVRLVTYIALLLLVGLSVVILLQIHRTLTMRIQQGAVIQANLIQERLVLSKFKSLKTQVITDQAQGVVATSIIDTYPEITKDILQADYASANTLLLTQSNSLAALLLTQKTADQVAEAKKGTLSGIVREGTAPLTGVTLDLIASNQVVASLTTDSTGAYSFKQDAATYGLTAELTGYTNVRLDGLTILPQQTVQQDVVLVKVPPPTPVPTPKPTPGPTPKPTTAPTPKSISQSTAYSTYTHTTVQASSGTFTADIMTFDLASGHIKVMEDTADDGDCTNNCNVKSVLSFVQQDGGFAGINGSYFCPTSYGDSCAGKTNSFYWKQYNSRLQKMINPDNTLGEQDPFLVFDASGHATYLQHWTDYKTSGINIYAGISCTPTVVRNGQYAVDDSTLDDKERTAKISRGSIGLKGQTLYVVTIQGATVEDLGHVMQALGVDNAMNTDAGGSSGMVYNNSYKLGPGRAVPNVLVFAQQ